jgi:murein DD-endopeptidase MepM/ murein hydrolase activator NlpD
MMRLQAISRPVLLCAAALAVLALLLTGPVTWAQDETVPTPEPTTTVPSTTLEPPAQTRPNPTTSVTVEGVTLDLLFGGLPQGQVGLMQVRGEGVVEARGGFVEDLYPFFTIADDGFYGLVSAGMDQTPRTYDLVVLAGRADGSTVTLNAQVNVTVGGFIRQDFVLPDNLGYLTDPEVERIELARLNSIFDVYTEVRLWDARGFRLPIDSALTSPFGAFRTVNQTPTRHTGWDFQAGVGTPVRAMGPGRVVFAGPLDIRGNYVIIDHGFGIYSGYAHLSVVHVTRGQSVAYGQFIGHSGSTGRSTGAHLHWEVSVNGNWIDSAELLQMWLPG